jgi:hypothetical protein
MNEITYISFPESSPDRLIYMIEKAYPKMKPMFNNYIKGIIKQSDKTTWDIKIFYLKNRKKKVPDEFQIKLGDKTKDKVLTTLPTMLKVPPKVIPHLYAKLKIIQMIENKVKFEQNEKH